MAIERQGRGARADDRHRFDLGVEWQDRVLVFQQDDAFESAFIDQRTVFRAIADFRFGEFRLTIDHAGEDLGAQDIAGGPFKLCFGDFATGDHAGKILGVEFRALAEIQFGGHRLFRAPEAVPVGHGVALKSPGIAQDGLDEIIVFAALVAIDEVVTAHHGLGAAILHGATPVSSPELDEAALID